MKHEIMGLTRVSSGTDMEKFPVIRLVNQARNRAPERPFWKAPCTLLPPPPNFASILLLGALLGLATWPGLPLSSRVPK